MSRCEKVILSSFCRRLSVLGRNANSVNDRFGERGSDFCGESGSKTRNCSAYVLMRDVVDRKKRRRKTIKARGKNALRIIASLPYQIERSRSCILAMFCFKFSSSLLPRYVFAFERSLFLFSFSARGIMYFLMNILNRSTPIGRSERVCECGSSLLSVVLAIHYTQMPFRFQLNHVNMNGEH